ncbi:Uncharacterized protein QTN25_004351 [Entamoeba marina]
MLKQTDEYIISIAYLIASTNDTIFIGDNMKCGYGYINQYGFTCLTTFDCFYGYYRNNNICSKCPIHCRTCNSPENCYICKNGYVLDNGNCIEDINCIKTDKNYCNICDNGLLLNGTTCSTPCSEKCISCNTNVYYYCNETLNNNGICQNITNTEVVSNSSILQCSNGYYNNKSESCELCNLIHLNCTICNNRICMECENGFNLNSNRECESLNCLNPKNAINGYCIECDMSNNYMMDENGNCLYTIATTPSTSSFWEKSCVINLQGNFPENSNVTCCSRQHEEDIYYIACFGELNVDLETVLKLLNSRNMNQYNPFITKFNSISTDVLEREVNVFGFSKSANCAQIYSGIRNSVHITTQFSITHDESKVIPYRDNGLVLLGLVLIPNGVKTKVVIINKAVIVPWFHPSSPRIAIDRTMNFVARYFKTLLEATEGDVLDYVTIERYGFEMVLPMKEFPGVLMSTIPEGRIILKNTFNDETTYIFQGSFQNRAHLVLTQENIIQLLFQQSCKVVEKKQRAVVLHKDGCKEKQISSDHVLLSLFTYADCCALAHFRSVHSPHCCFAHSNSLERSNKFFFNSAYFFFSVDDEDTTDPNSSSNNPLWTIQFYLDVTTKDSNPLNSSRSQLLLRDFILSISQSFDDFNLTPSTSPSLIPKSFTTSFMYENVSTDTSSLFPHIPQALLKRICLLLDPSDINSLSLTNKHINSLLKYSFRRGPSPNPSNEIIGAVKSDSSPQNCDVELINNPTPYVFEGHSKVIRSVDIHKNAPMIVSGSSDRKIRLWRIGEESDKSQVFIGPNSSVLNTRFIDDSIAVAYKTGTIKYLNMLDSRKTLVFDALEGGIEGFYPIESTEFLVWNEKIELVRYENLHQNVLFTYEEHVRKVSAVRPFANFTYISGSADRTLHVWDVRLANPTIHKIRAHKSGVFLLESLDEHNFLSVGNEKKLCFWDERELSKPVWVVDNQLECLCVHKEMIVCGNGKGDINLYNKNGNNIGGLSCGENVELTAITMRNKQLVTGAKNGKIFYFDRVLV